ncbi:hypothetical protein [Nocardia sp. NPDC051570]|uniref:hypothetical protein n=1 Tax=Nocardia sp. NPDC051570 TaxID=3364324 RepID=UPI0037B441D6
MRTVDGEFASPRQQESTGQRFGRQLEAFRQRDLPDRLLTRQQIHELGGPTRNVQSRIESGRVDTISATTEAKDNRALEALGLPPGSATDALYHGGTLDPARENSSGPDTDDGYQLTSPRAGIDQLLQALRARIAPNDPR